MSHSEAFNEAFSLLDVKGDDTVDFDTIVEFCSTFPKPPKREIIKKIYSTFDSDGSGDIDRDEFCGLLKALETETSLSTDEMVATYTSHQYKRLFMLFSDTPDIKSIKDTDEFRKDDLKVFLDLCAGFLNISSTDIGVKFRASGATMEVCPYPVFRDVVSKVIKGKSIKRVVEVFTEATKNRRAQKDRAIKSLTKEDTRKTQVKPKNEDDIASILRSATAMEPPEDTSAFCEAFDLMDSRGGRVINIESIMEFCSTFPKPPSQNSVRKLYDHFDEDGSGDIDPEEFIGLCLALEKLTHLSTTEMCNYFKKEMYKRLFELVDQGGDGNSEVSKDELRRFLEAISPLLSSKYTMEDIYNMVKQYECEELNLEQFTSLVGELLRGKSISQIIDALEKSRRQVKASRHKARKTFESKNNRATLNLPTSVHSELSGGVSMRICFSCTKKTEEIRSLQREIDMLRGELVQAKAAAAAAAAEPQAQPEPPQPQVDLRALIEEDTMHGNPFHDLHTLHSINTAPYYSKFPQLARPALHANRCSRFSEFCKSLEDLTSSGAVDINGNSRKINELGPRILTMMEQMRSSLAPIIDEVTDMLNIQEDLQRLILSHNLSPNPEALTEKLDLLDSYRSGLVQSTGDVEWMLDSVVEDWSEATSAAVSSAPFATKCSMILGEVNEAETSVQALLDIVTVLLLFSSKQLSDVEIQAKRLVAKAVDNTDQTLISAMLETITDLKSKLSKTNIFNLLDNMVDIVKNLMKTASTTCTTKRDKGCMTMQVDFAVPEKKEQKHVKVDELAALASNSTDPRHQEIGNRSSSPRQRTKVMRPKDVVAHVDKLLTEYHQVGVQLPENFRRVEPNTNIFQFGTKKIELSAVDKSVIVKVGGGYLLFEEFCNKFSALEERRVKFQHLRSEPLASSTNPPRKPRHEHSGPAHETRVALTRGSYHMLSKLNKTT